MPKKNQIAEEDYKNVMQSIEEYIFQSHKFPSKTQVSELTNIPKEKCDVIIEQLIRQNQLYSVFGGGHGYPEVILPYDMMQGVIMTQKRPDWLQGESYSFKEKADIESQIRESSKSLIMYDMFERLLYCTDIPLEEAVAYTLNWLGFQNVIHHKENKDYADVTFDCDGLKLIVEVEGTTKQGDKPKVLQLDGWIKTEIEKEERDQSLIRGLFVINHFREMEPEKRGDPLTKHAKDFLKRYQFLFFTTLFLFNIVKQANEGKLKPEDARKLVMEGERIR
jgi:hypothetical protein